MAYYKRIGDNDMTSEFVDGSVLLHTDMNEIETLTKTGINANYEDIQKLQDGTLTVQTAVNATNATNATNASKLSGATLSKYADENLQDNDGKIPTSKQVKNYVDTEISGLSMDYPDLTNKPSINGVTLIGNKTTEDLGLNIDVPIYYWNGLNTPANVAMFNEICGKYTNGEKFVLVGKVALENGYTYNGTFYERTIDVIVPFSVKDFTEYEDTENTGHSVFSFMTDPVRTTGGYAVGSVDLTGYAWGAFTAISPVTWSYSEGPAMSGNTINIVLSLPAADYTNVGKVYQYMGATDANYTKGYFYTCVEIPGSGTSTYEWQQLDVQPGVVDYDDLIDKPSVNSITLSGNKTSSDLGLQDTLVSGTNIKTINSTSLLNSGDIGVIEQVTTMPSANVGAVGKTIQYVGITTSNYINGYFYQCVLDGTSYIWQNVNVQSNSSGPNIIILTENEYNALTNYEDNTEYHIIES